MLFLYDGGALRATPQRAGPLSRRLLHDSRGVTLVLVALAATVLLGFTALGVETGLWYAVKRQDQSAADAAALSGAYERAAGQTYSQICAQVKHDAAANGFTFLSYSCPNSTPACTSPSTGQMCANNPPVSGSNAGDDKAVEVILNRQQNTYLANLFLPSVTIGTRAVAKVNLPGYTCDLSLAHTGTGISVQGSATLNLTGCGMAANSSDAASISFGGGNNDVLDASWFQTVGNYSSNGSPVLNVTTKLIDSTPVTDPYSCNPPQLGCAGQITYSWPATPVNSTSPCYPWTGAPTTLQPGLYGKSSGSHKCSDGSGSSSPPMDFSSGTTKLCPGVYYLDGEDNHGYAFNVHGGTVQMGTTADGCASGIGGVTIIIGSQPAGSGGGFQIQSGTVNLSAPTARNPSGCTFGSTFCIPSGILFYQDPADADTHTHGGGLTGDSTITANTGTSLQGAMYTPATNVKFSGNAGSTCFIVISLTMTYTGDSTMAGDQTNCQAVGVTGPTVMNISLTE
jgi:Flp pilus assembly protein TadG